ncbi:Imm8 family immunity protein [Paenibacillus sp. GYB004]|uniref:Imm8 family immunity protein n=1 Tax=Paenibacillus sp. GYB004 TaxID=2994393 RepID=UPI002F96900D
MVIPVLKGIDYIGNTDDLDNSKIRVTAYISEENDIGADCFHFQVISSEYLAKFLSENNTFDGRATFIVNKFDITQLEIEINKILKDCIRPTWDEVAKAINRHLKWEYDNIKYMTSEEILTKIDQDK